MPPPSCPNCGAVVPADAKACPECGSDEETGWSDEAYDPKPDLPDDEFDYEEYSKKEFGSKDPVPQGISVLWWIVGIAVTAAILYICLR
jgi:hypothetical protein